MSLTAGRTSRPRGRPPDKKVIYSREMAGFVRRRPMWALILLVIYLDGPALFPLLQGGFFFRNLARPFQKSEKAEHRPTALLKCVPGANVAQGKPTHV